VRHGRSRIFDEYTALLERFAFRSGLVMKPIRQGEDPPVRDLRRSEDERCFRHPGVLEEKLARPSWSDALGRRGPDQAFGLHKGRPGFDLINPEDIRAIDPMFKLYGRRRRTADTRCRRTVVRTNPP